jgi:flavin reductase (DIM6/NTAB) family NADH-FMN oxidoreductase RutF
MSDIGEALRNAMRRWATGVTIVTSQFENYYHGMTVNSFTSLSLDPPMVTITLAHNTRTYGLVIRSGAFAVTILNDTQGEISDRFAGKIPEDGDRFAGLGTFRMISGTPLLAAGLAFIDCRVVHRFEMQSSTLFIGEVLAAQNSPDVNPLVYFNRDYHRLTL